MDLQRLARIAERQLGLITTAQLFEVGATPRWIQRQLQSGRLVRVRRKVFRVGGSPATQDQAWLAAALEVGTDAFLSHGTAAFAWSLKGFDQPDRIDVLVPGRDRSRVPGVRGRQTLWLPEFDRSRLRRIPITSAERTLIDAAGGLHPWVLGRAVDDAIRRKLITLARLTRCFAAVPLSGRRPSVGMKSVLAGRGIDFDPGAASLS